ncbi:MAG: shikimate kinase [Micrococcales bacterium]
MIGSNVIVLIGPMGVGKTTIGKKLAANLNVPFRDTDAMFVKRFGEITAYFASHGEEAFRAHEEDIIAEAIAEPGVVATGGGAILSAATQQRLKAVSVVYLSTDGTHMGKRISQGNRPLLKDGLNDWRAIYEKRKPIYEANCDFQIDCSGTPIKDSVAEIKTRLKLND